MEFSHIGFIKFGLIDLVDILIVGFLFYKILSLMKGTRAIQIATGLILIFLIAFLAFWFQLESLKWIITNIATVGIIVLVIVFQPEIREALAQFGHNRLIRLFFKYEKQKTLDEIVKGVSQLSQMKHGSLIILEREIGLRNFAQTGKYLNAQVSADLLVTIFTPYTPLHDGAAIISGEFVIAVACTLPLSSNPIYAELFGMRHKAAIGITEQSDALAIAVSEESGGISVAHQGRLHRNIDKVDLKEFLLNLDKKT
jgi:diadenylate cyclase